jgi:hypothetical protein
LINFIAARQDGFIEEVNLSNGLTGYTGLVPVISGGQLVSISVNNGTSLWSSYDANAGDFGASQLNYGSFTGFSPAGSVVPESSTYGALFMGVSAFLLALRKKGHLKNLVSKINDYKNSKLKTSDCSVEFATNTFSKNDSLNFFFVHDCLESRVNNLRKLDVNYFEPPPIKSRFENLSYTAANYS